MDRPSTSTNPLFMEQDDDMNSFVTKSHLFGAQRALHQEQQAMSERIDNLAADLRLSEQHTRDYFVFVAQPLDMSKGQPQARRSQARERCKNGRDSCFVAQPHFFHSVLIKTEPLKSTLRLHHLRLKYTDIEHSSSCRASRSSRNL